MKKKNISINYLLLLLKKNKNNILHYSFKVLISCILIVVVVIISNYLGRYVNSIDFNNLSSKNNKDELKKKKNSLSLLIGTIVKYSVYFIGFYMIFNFLGFNTSLILASFGTLGLAFALGLQGSLSNVISGILMTITGNYKIGDVIETSAIPGLGIYNSLVGKIINYNLLTIQIQEVNTGILHTIPNKIIWDSVVSNYNYFKDQIYITVKIVISQDNDLKKVKKIVRDICNSDDKIIKENTWPSPFINYFNPDKRPGITILLKFLTDVKNYPNIEDTIQNDIIMKLKEKNIKFLDTP